MAPIQLALFRVEGIPAPTAGDGLLDTIAAELLAGRFRGREGSRFGFWRPQRLGYLLFGTFAHETSEEITDYRSTDDGVEQILSATHTFEHYSFVLALDQQIALLQRRRLPQTKALTNQDVIRDFGMYLSDFVVPYTNRFASLRPFEDEIAETEVRQLLAAGRVVRVRVGRLAGRRVPASVDLTNPRPEANGVLHEYMDHDFSRGVSEVSLRADPGNPDADINDSFYAKGAIAAGEVQEVEVMIGDRLERRIRENRRATIEADEPLTPEQVVQLLERVNRREYEIVSDDGQPTLFGPEGLVS